MTANIETPRNGYERILTEVPRQQIANTIVENHIPLLENPNIISVLGFLGKIHAIKKLSEAKAGDITPLIYGSVTLIMAELADAFDGSVARTRKNLDKNYQNPYGELIDAGLDRLGEGVKLRDHLRKGLSYSPNTFLQKLLKNTAIISSITATLTSSLPSIARAANEGIKGKIVPESGGKWYTKPGTNIYRQPIIITSTIGAYIAEKVFNKPTLGLAIQTIGDSIVTIGNAAALSERARIYFDPNHPSFLPEETKIASKKRMMLLSGMAVISSGTVLSALLHNKPKS